MGIVQTTLCGGFKNYIQKNVNGILVIDTHKLLPNASISDIKNEQQLKSLIIQSLISLQQKSNIFMPQYNKNPEIINEQSQQDTQGGGLFKKKITSKNTNINPKNIEFASFKLNSSHYPYIVSFSLNIDMLEGDHIFCENLEKQSYEIFDQLEEKGEISFITSFWFMGEKDFSQENQKQPGKKGKKPNKEEQFLTDNDEEQLKIISQNKQQANLETPQQQHLRDKYHEKFEAIPENEENTPSLEITQEYFDKYYKLVLTIYESENQVLYLYYDSLKDKLLTVKQIKNQFDYIDTIHDQIENERKRVIKAVRDTHLPDSERFNDTFDEEIKGLKRNIVREIMIEYNCNQLFKVGINKLEGVVIGDKNYKIVNEFFGGSEIHNNQLTCDLESYFSKNIQGYFSTKQFPETQAIIQEIFMKIMETVEKLHEQGIFLREILAKNILIRRKYNPLKPQTSQYEIQLINFGKSKRVPLEPNPEFETQAPKANKGLTNVQSQKILVKPQQLFGREANDQKNALDLKRDDTFQLGILLYKLYQLTGLEGKIDEKTKKNLQLMTGLPFEIMIEFYTIMSKVKILFKGGQEEALRYEEKIQDLSQIKSEWGKQSTPQPNSAVNTTAKPKANNQQQE